jgi:uncharacterized membrane protein YqjE
MSDQPRAAEPSTGELVSRLSEQVSRLVKDELALARIEMTSKAKGAGTGIGMFGGAGLLALYGVGALVAAAILGIAEGLPAWLAALIVAVVILLVAGVVALIGKRNVQRATPLKPEETIGSVKRDVDEVSKAARRDNTH